MAKVFISLGSNLGNRQLNLEQAVATITLSIGLLKQRSAIYQTQSWGFQSFNNFLNQVILVETNMSALELLEKLLEIERAMGRIRHHAGYSDRIIDLDILFYDQDVISSNQLQVPHPMIDQRRFVLKPLNDIGSEFVHPTLHKSVGQMLKECQDPNELELYET